MKKTVILAVLGMAAGVASSYGQGSIAFNTYTANNSTSYIALQGGNPVPNTYTAVLLYSLSAISDPAGTGPLNPGWSFGPTGSEAVTGIPGTFAGNNLVIPTYTSGPVYFQIAVYSGASYATSQYAGHTASFSQSMATGLATAWTADGSPATGGSGYLPPTFTVAAVPEPTTLALAGLGGLASLVALRRKQA